MMTTKTKRRVKMQKIEFKKGQWEEILNHSYTARFPYTEKFLQGDGWVSNSVNPKMKDGYNYITLMTKERYKKGTKISTTCTFTGSAAPLIVFTDKLFPDENGELRYCDYHEVVLWKNGINVWDLYKDGEEIKIRLLLEMKFSVEENKKYEISTTLTDKGIEIAFEGRTYGLRVDNIPEEVFIGVTACEGLTKFYDMTIFE